MSKNNLKSAADWRRMQSPVDFIHSYYSVFSSLDLNAIARHFSEPCLSIGRGRVFVAMNRIEFGEAISSLVDELRAKGYSHSEFADAETVMLSDTAALVRGVALRYAQTGREIERVPISYLLQNNGADWQIVVLILSP
jgi:hypothetical protein